MTHTELKVRIEYELKRFDLKMQSLEATLASIMDLVIRYELLNGGPG